MSRTLAQLGLAALAVLALSASASATPVVYTMQGTLSSSPPDRLSLAGATIVVVATADTDQSPIEVLSDDGFTQSRYDESGTVTFSNRPGGAPDVLLNYASTTLVTENRFPPEAAADSFFLDSAPTIHLEGTLVTLPGFLVYIQNQEFFPGNGVAPLPLFSPGDVASLTADPLFVGDFLVGARYELTNVSLIATPEPAPALLLAAGLAALAVRRLAA